MLMQNLRVTALQISVLAAKLVRKSVRKTALTKARLSPIISGRTTVCTAAVALKYVLSER